MRLNARYNENIFPQHAPAKAKRRAAETLGRQAEDEVAGMLRQKGYAILAVRLKTGAGEIDIVAADHKTLIFVEVKARPSFAEAAYALSPRQQARLFQAATVAMACHDNWARPETRFDAALVVPGGIEIIEDAFRLN
ncbi:MAG: YraN family protein [Rhodospirillales bacterium]|nr:YraN family protein [Rhodospirillales bacterium]MDE2391997.1 YraN family protein [Rhodospirillales bacterium]